MGFCTFFLLQVVPTHYSMRSSTLGAPNKKDYIAELTKQLDTIQRVSPVSLLVDSVAWGKKKKEYRFELKQINIKQMSEKCRLIAWVPDQKTLKECQLGSFNFYLSCYGPFAQPFIHCLKQATFPPFLSPLSGFFPDWLPLLNRRFEE